MLDEIDHDNVKHGRFKRRRSFSFGDDVTFKVVNHSKDLHLQGARTRLPQNKLIRIIRGKIIGGKPPWPKRSISLGEHPLTGNRVLRLLPNQNRKSLLKVWRKLEEAIPDQRTMETLIRVLNEELAPLPITNNKISAKATSKGSRFIERANRLEKTGHRDAAMDLIYDGIDELMRNGEFIILDSLLRDSDVQSLTTDVLIGILTASLPARKKLRSRSQFFGAAKQEFQVRGEYEDGLLTGLE